ncbi:MAG TPA: AraC family transcriptional regulator, partial [Nevskiales bacterium]|nr:AraC family transcriptional regulator [Nevskiales bacterium]
MKQARLKPDWQLRRSVSSAVLLTQFAARQGIPLRDCLAGTGIAPESLADPQGEIEARQELRLLHNVAPRLQPGQALELGQLYHLTTYGIWGFALISSPTLRAAFSLGLRYFDLAFSYCHIHMETDRDEARLILDDGDIPEALRQFLVERDLAAMQTIQRELFSAPMPLRRLECRFPAPPYAAQFTALFGVQPRFGAPRNVAVLDAARLDRPLPQANPLTAQLCEQQCQQLLARRRARSGIAGRVRDRLLRQPGMMADMETIAAELHMTSRTLRRRLDEEGTSYRALVDEVRAALAEEMLAGTRLSVEEVAERLGYAEASSFIH